MITVLDTIAPDFTVPSDATLYLDANCMLDSTIANLGDITIVQNPAGLTAPTVEIVSPQKDTWISESDPTLNYGASSTIETQLLASQNKNGVMVYDLTPYAGQTVLSVTMYMYLEQGAGNGAIMSTYPIVINQWDEGTGNGTPGATNWTQATPTTNWLTPGGSFHNGIIGSMETKATGYNAMPMDPAAWQFVIDNPSSSLGMLLFNDNTYDGTLVFTSKEGPANQRPYIKLEFASDPTTSTCNEPLDTTYVDDLSGLNQCNNTGTFTRTWTLTDACGNSTSGTQTITVLDTIAPIIVGTPADETISCDAVPTPPVLGTDITVTDNCDPSVTFEFEETITAGACAGTYILTREWTATDACSNETVMTQTITVEDLDAPVISGVPADVTVECNAVPTPPVIGTDITAVDNCDTNPTITLNETTTPGTCAGNYILEREWTATDDCGNDTTIVQTITVQDLTAPVLSGIPADETVECDAIPTAPVIGTDITATDNCDTAPTITLNETTTPGVCAGTYTLTREWTAEDDCGNITTETQTITVEDTTAPVLSGIPADETVECDAIPTAPVIGTDITATDNCDTDPVITLNETTTPGVCAGTYILTREWAAEDECGNIVTETQTITVEDTTAPVLSLSLIHI